jgi:hypothetical protein
MIHDVTELPVIPAEAGIHCGKGVFWMPVFMGMTAVDGYGRE